MLPITFTKEILNGKLTFTEEILSGKLHFLCSDGLESANFFCIKFYGKVHRANIAQKPQRNSVDLLTAQKMEFSTKDFFSKCDHAGVFLRKQLTTFSRKLFSQKRSIIDVRMRSNYASATSET